MHFILLLASSLFGILAQLSVVNAEFSLRTKPPPLPPRLYTVQFELESLQNYIKKKYPEDLLYRLYNNLVLMHLDQVSKKGRVSRFITGDVSIKY